MDHEAPSTKILIVGSTDNALAGQLSKVLEDRGIQDVRVQVIDENHVSQRDFHKALAQMMVIPYYVGEGPEYQKHNHGGKDYDSVYRKQNRRKMR